MNVIIYDYGLIFLEFCYANPYCKLHHELWLFIFVLSIKNKEEPTYLVFSSFYDVCNK